MRAPQANSGMASELLCCAASALACARHRLGAPAKSYALSRAGNWGLRNVGDYNIGRDNKGSNVSTTCRMAFKFCVRYTFCVRIQVLCTHCDA